MLKAVEVSSPHEFVISRKSVEKLWGENFV